MSGYADETREWEAYVEETTVRERTDPANAGQWFVNSPKRTVIAA